ncbi:MAG: DUF4234 domain-containing protein [Actinomycetota bacterium]|nr:DUF4234 domain-containing protein [Actinomycetota bacterium]
MSTVPPPPPPPPQPGYGGPADYGGAGGYIGEQKSIGSQVLISILTLGFYGWYWIYRCHEDVKLHSGQGIGGVVGMIIYIVFSIVNVFLLPIEIQKMYEQEGQTSPVRWTSGFWIFLFAIPWYWKMQSALNQHWAMHGAPPADGFKI